jgi:hypothetical protein
VRGGPVFREEFSVNPVRARMAESLEESRLTSVHDRICGRAARLKTASLQDIRLKTGDLKAGSPGEAKARGEEGRERERTEEQEAMIEEAKTECGRDAWLCRFAARVKGCAPRDSRVKGCAPRDSRVKGDAPRDRVQRGVLPESARPVLERMELDVVA